MSKTVVIVGAGYGGTALAKSLDDVADVVLIEPRDTFVHNTAALRGVVEPGWADRIFLPYDRLLRHGRIVHDRVTRAHQDGVELDSGEHLRADYLVLATGSTHSFPGKPDSDDTDAYRRQLTATRDELSQASGVLLLGAGPFGLELAGEIRAAWPDKAVTVVDPAPTLFPEFPEEFRSEIGRQLDSLDIRVLSGARLREVPPTPVGKVAPFTATTTAGDSFEADLWFRCYGEAPVTGYLSGSLTAARRPDGRVEVTPELRLSGQDRVFAIGDITALPEAKMAATADEHAQVVATNIRTLIQGGSGLSTHTPPGPGMLVPLGRGPGAGYTPDTGVLGPEPVTEYKGDDLMLASYRELLGLT